MRAEPTTEWRWLYGALVLAVAVLFLAGIRTALTPMIAYVLLVMLLAPWAGTDRHTTAVFALTLGLLIWLLHSVGSLLAPFILALVLAYILDPLVDRLEARGVGRSSAVAIVMVPLLGLVVLALVLGIPALIQQFESLLARLPAAAAAVSAWIEQVRTGTTRIRIPFLPQETLMRWLHPDRVSAFVSERQDMIAAQLWNAVTGVGRGVSVALSVLGYVVLTPVLLIYLLRDFNRLTARIGQLVPARRRDSWHAFAREYDGLLSRFLRGQVIAAAIVGVLTWLGLWIAGVPYSGLVGAVAGVFNLVPYLGLIVSIIPVFIIALLSGAFLATLVKAGIVFAIVQTIDGTITGPRIVGESVGLHPVWVILALALAGAFFGFVGLLIAMPAAVLIKLLLREAMARYERSAAFLGTPETKPPSPA